MGFHRCHQPPPRLALAVCFVLAYALGFASTRSVAGELEMQIGPPELGSGGSNPVSVPPVNPLEYQFEYVTDHDYEWTLAVAPGVFFGKRSRLPNGVYVGLGGGAVFDTNGIGPGVYSSLGYSTKGKLKFIAEMKQGLGYDFSRKSVIAPYAIRIGCGYGL